jgi:inorganic pyrophosphatase
MRAHPWHDIPLSEGPADWFPVFIEMSKGGSKVRYELDKVTGLLTVSRVLCSAVYYPANYGIVPRTCCADKGPLGVLVLGQEAVAPAATLRVRAVGAMRLRGRKGQKDKLVGVHVDDPAYSDYRDIADLPQHRRWELQRFVLDCKVLDGEEVVMDALQGAAQALSILRETLACYANRRATPREGVARGAIK